MIGLCLCLAVATVIIICNKLEKTKTPEINTYYVKKAENPFDEGNIVFVSEIRSSTMNPKIFMLDIVL